MASKRMTMAELQAAYIESGAAPVTFPVFLAMRRAKTPAAMMAILDRWKRSEAGQALALRRASQRLIAQDFLAARAEGVSRG